MELILLFTVSKEKRIIYQDSIHNLYPKLSFLFAKVFKMCMKLFQTISFFDSKYFLQFLFEVPLAVLVYTIYGTPLYFMAKLATGSNDQGSAFAIYLALNLLHCFSLRTLSWTFAYALPNKYQAQFVTGNSKIQAGIVYRVLSHFMSFQESSFASVR